MDALLVPIAFVTTLRPMRPMAASANIVGPEPVRVQKWLSLV